MWSGALFKNGFAYQLNTDRSNVECSILEGKSGWDKQGLDKDLEQATISVFANAIEETGENTKTSTFKIQNKFKQPVDHETFGVAPYNPFIFLHQNTDKNRTEVHLVNHGPTSKENMICSIPSRICQIKIKASIMCPIRIIRLPFICRMSSHSVQRRRKLLISRILVLLHGHNPAERQIRIGI